LPLQLFAQYFAWIGQVRDDRLQLISAIGGALVSLAASSVMILIISPAVIAGWGTRRGPAPVPVPSLGEVFKKLSLWSHFQKQIGPLAIESMRMLPKGILLTILLVIPGLYYFVRMSFLPYLVQFSSRYSMGEVDVLKYSYKFTQRAQIATVLLAIFTGALQFGLISAMGSFSIWQQPVAFAFIFVLSVPVSIAVEVVWTSLFMALFEGAEDELVFPVA